MNRHPEGRNAQLNQTPDEDLDPAGAGTGPAITQNTDAAVSTGGEVIAWGGYYPSRTEAERAAFKIAAG